MVMSVEKVGTECGSIRIGRYFVGRNLQGREISSAHSHKRAQYAIINGYWRCITAAVDTIWSLAPRCGRSTSPTHVYLGTQHLNNHDHGKWCRSARDVGRFHNEAG